MINVPADRGDDWDSLKNDARSIILKKLKKEHGINIESRLEFEEIATPKSIEQNSYSISGALYGNNSNSIWAAFNRHPNFSKRVKNLFFTGGSVHPGGGIPLCLASAKIVEEEVVSYYQQFT
jgi:phytoene dehydrogenase-like protein